MIAEMYNANEILFSSNIDEEIRGTPDYSRRDFARDSAFKTALTINI